MKSSEIDHGDWRLQTTTHLIEEWLCPWTGVVSPKGTRITVVSVIQLTRNKVLSIPIPNATASMLNASAQAYERARALRLLSGIDKTLKTEVSFRTEEDALDYVERMIEAIVLAYSAIEAFANETIPSDYIYASHKKSKVLLEVDNKQAIERHLSTDDKLTLVLPEVLSCNSPKTSNSWQDYKKLKKSRDRIIHMKTEDRKSSNAEADTVWKAIILSPAPHLAAKNLIDYFVKAMIIKPKWHERFLNKTSY